MRMAIFVPYWCTHPRHEKRTAMWLRIGCKLDFHIASPTPLILMLRPRSGAQQWVARESYMLTPSVPVLEFSDAYGNLCQRLVAPHGAVSIHTSADVQTADSIDVARGAPFDEVQNLPDGVLSFLLPSRYCESDRYFDMASGIVAGVAPGYDQVACISDWIRREVRFNPASAHERMAASEVNQRREGVCRDLAHLASPCAGDCAFRRAWWWAICMDSRRWTCMRGSKPTSADAGTPSTPPRTRRAAAAWPSPTDTTPPTWRSSTSSDRPWRRTRCG